MRLLVFQVFVYRWIFVSKVLVMRGNLFGGSFHSRSVGLSHYFFGLKRILILRQLSCLESVHLEKNGVKLSVRERRCDWTKSIHSLGVES
jgi:hypothetical protein